MARRLAVGRGVLEPLQSATSVDGQVEELRASLDRHADTPITLIGWSWGALLGFIFAARHPSYVSKLILVSSAPFTDAYASGIWQTRMARLSEDERAEAQAAVATLGDANRSDKMPAFKSLGSVLHKSDSYEPFTDESEVLEVQPEVFEKVWGEVETMRRSGELLELGRQIECSVVAIHGDYDPHPAEGVRAPLSSVIEDFRFILLERCGHTPWIETYAHERFFDVLKEELVLC